jgi:hypothetical protein
MAVKELPPFVWWTFAEGRVALSEEGAVATQISEAEEGEGAASCFGGNYGSGAD